MAETPGEDVSLAIALFQGLVGVGKLLRIYDLDKKKLLHMCENKHVPNLVTGIHTICQRVIVTDVQESLFWVRYKRSENRMIILAGSPPPACWTTTPWLQLTSLATSALCVCPPNSSDEDPTGSKALWNRGLLNGASQKAEVIMNYHIGETVLSLQKTTRIPGSLVWSTQVCRRPGALHFPRECDELLTQISV